MSSQAPAPTLVIQMQRMGDLVMTFPLMAWLRKMEPERPVWVLAESRFYEGLMPFAPDVVFFDVRAAHALTGTRFHRIINLSNRPEAARFSGEAGAETKIGSIVTPAGRFIGGEWQLYRASIVHNNRHNRMHWSDLASLDVIPGSYFSHTLWPVPRSFTGSRKVGLFVGASEAEKRPDPMFWAALAKELIKRGMFPVFLGGTADKPLAARAAREAGIPHADLSGRFSLAKFAEFIRELDLFITPDTGPMHVAAWIQVQTLNLSMGPVNPWETAPAVPGHFVLRAEPSCSGCWECTRRAEGATPPCHQAFSPVRIAALAHSLFQGGTGELKLPGLHLMRTNRDTHGLFTLVTTDQTPARLRDLYGDLWREFFLRVHAHPQADIDRHVRALYLCDPRAAELLKNKALLFLKALAKPKCLPGDFWMSFAPLVRPLSGYAQLVLDNHDRSEAAFTKVRTHVMLLLESLQKGLS